MRRTVRLLATVGPVERLGDALASLPAQVQRALIRVAERSDLPLAAGAWSDGQGGCLVANVVACTPATQADRSDDATGGHAPTLDIRMLDAFPEMSSRDLNTLIVAWDTAAAQDAAADDAALRRLLVGALRRAGVALDPVDPVDPVDPASRIPDPGAPHTPPPVPADDVRKRRDLVVSAHS